MNGQTIALTGATGFLGRHVARALMTRGHTVRALVRDPDKARRTLPALETGALEWVVGDVFDRGTMDDLVAGANAVVHTIGIRREFRPEITFDRLHVAATLAAVTAAVEGGVERFIHISALGVRPDAPTAYQRTKYEAETLVRRSGLKWTILRPSIMHGPDSEFVQMVKSWVLSRSAPWFFLPYFARVEKSGGFPPQFRIASAQIQPVGAEEVAGAVATALERDQAIGEIYALGGAERIDWPGLLRAIRDAMPVTEPNKRIVPLPGRVGWMKALAADFVGLGGALPFGPSEPVMAMEDSICDLSKAKEHLDFAPRAFSGAVRSYAAQI